MLASCAGDSGNVNNSQQDPDPIVADFPIAYVKRPLPVAEDGAAIQTDAREPYEFIPGAVLYLRDSASPSANERDISSVAFEVVAEAAEAAAEPATELLQYDVKDLSSSYDGKKLLFAMRAPEIEDADDEDQPTWNIWEYAIPTQTLRRVIESDIIAEAGQDISPHYLPDGRIVFASTRQRTSKAILLDEGKPQYAALDEDRNQAAAVLHVMDSDGQNVEQISFNQSHDLNPTVLTNGKILFSRWDNMGSRNEMNFYTINPDGTQLTYMYGAHSHEIAAAAETNTVQFYKAEQLPNNEILTILQDYTTQIYGSDIFSIDVTDYTDYNQPTWENQSLTLATQTSLSYGLVTTDGSTSPQGRFNSAYPLYDGTNRLLVSWSQCRFISLIDEQESSPQESSPQEKIVPCNADTISSGELEEAAPLYGIWIYDLDELTQLPVVKAEENMMYGEVVAIQERDYPTVLTDLSDSGEVNQELVNENVGILHIRSVYDFDGVDSADPNITTLADPALTTADQRPARFLRLVKPVSMPDDDVLEFDGTAFGVSQGQLMREIIGYAPIEPDGSVKVKVPANVAFNMSILNSEGKRISTLHQNWLQVRPGEELECRGCHAANSSSPHGRPDAQAPSINAGAAASNVPFSNTSASLLPQVGESMAETITRINGVPTPTFDLLYTDQWTDTNVRAADPAISLLYSDLSTAAPASSTCMTTWNARCRITVNYESHIAPLWDVNRQQLDIDGVTVLSDNTCSSCHGTQDSNEQLQTPIAQLDLSNIAATDEPDHFISYRELFFPDVEQEIANGVLIDRLIPLTDGDGNVIFATDDAGNVLLDVDGNPIPQTTTVAVDPILNVNGAVNNEDFFSLFRSGGSHENYLSPAELKLISEWLDIGAQYYNNPFDAPQN